jgi:PAS domain S-box-containing protein
MSDVIQVLHVDDEPGFADMTAVHLEREDEQFVVDTATSAADALERLSEDVDCVVSDYEMPGMDGIELLSAVRTEYPDLPFILFTGKGSETIASEAISAGVTDYLRKRSGSEQYELLAARITTAVGQYRAERELERQNDLFAKARDLGDIGAWEYDPQEEEAYFTDEVHEIYGVDTDHDVAPEADIQQFYHPEDCETVREAVEGALESGEPYDIEVRVIAADGTQKWVRTRADPQFEDGTCQRVRGTIRDITERKERERDIEQQQTRLTVALEGAKAGVWEWVPGTNDVIWHESTERLFGLEPGTFEGTYEAFADRVHDEDIGNLESAIESALPSRDPFEAEYRIHTADGGELWAYARGKFVDIEGLSPRYIGVITDITERKERERELQRQNERLDEFVSVVSHDLGNPLRTLSLSLEVIETDDEAELERCRQSVDRMQRLIDDLLALARHGETSSEEVPVSLDAVSRECWQTTVPPDVDLSVGTDATVVADRARLKQLFDNLFSNAVEHGSTSSRTQSDDAVEHGGDVSITIGELDGGFYVEDDGVGIPEDERESCFGIGYSTSEDGTGFGLNIVEQVAAAHGWDVRVTESSEGGARFEITGVEFEE